MAYAPGAGTTRTAPRTPVNRPPASTANGRAARGAAAEAPKTSRRPSATFLAGLGIGLAIGAAAGLLLAPRSGAETRRALRNRGKKVGNKARDAWDDLALELEATRRALKRKRRDAKLEIEEEKAEG